MGCYDVTDVLWGLWGLVDLTKDHWLVPSQEEAVCLFVTHTLGKYVCWKEPREGLSVT